MSGKAVYWLLTIPEQDFIHPSPLPECLAFVKGQLEVGADTGYRHYQVLACYSRQVRLAFVKRTFGQSCHAEPSKSKAADDYVWKDDTAVSDTRFAFGKKPLRRNNGADWSDVLDRAKRSDWDNIPPDVYIRYYGSLKKIGIENAVPIGVEKSIIVYWGPTGTGKSRTAWSNAGLDAYPKDPLTKFWDGYRGQSNVVIDEFRGVLGISHLLRWLDRYPVLVEVKGSSTVLKAERIWITSNLHPKEWYPDLDNETIGALLRRLDIVHMFNPF